MSTTLNEHKKLYTQNDTSFVVSSTEEEYVLKVRDRLTEDKPREKLINYGPEYLTAQELLAVVLNVGT